MNELFLERECDAPDDWESNVILLRDGRGRIVEFTVPDDDEEVTDDAAGD